jgi:tRNA nucleotidyltransferase/poly(A) polymerase
MRVKFNLQVPKDIIKIKDIFVSNGYKLFVVGGAVRDSLLKKSIKDWDLATDAKPDIVENMMKTAGLRTLGTGKSFGVINVFTDSDEYEIATFRSDLGSDGRRPNSVEFTNIDTDVMRRDLTINALFYDIETGEVVDLVGGIDDLKNRVVRTVGSANDRFGEDRLRILRAIRFAGRFNSDLDADAEKSLANDASLEGISSERIRDEFLKGIKTAKSIKYFLGLLNQYNLLDWIFKDIQNVDTDFQEERDPTVLLAYMLRNNDPKQLNGKLNKLTYSINEIRGIVFLVNLTMLNVNNVYELKKMQNNSGVNDEQIRKFSNLVGLNTELFESFIKFELSIGGAEVQKLGIEAGPEMGRMIKKLELQNFLKYLN